MGDRGAARAERLLLFYTPWRACDAAGSMRRHARMVLARREVGSQRCHEFRRSRYGTNDRWLRQRRANNPTKRRTRQNVHAIYHTLPRSNSVVMPRSRFVAQQAMYNSYHARRSPAQPRQTPHAYSSVMPALEECQRVQAGSEIAVAARTRRQAE